MKIGIFFGGQSREREVSFAGGRTVYDNLNKSIFEPVPIFVDSLGNFILLDWQFVYKGTIRDFYPPISHIPDSNNPFQIYLESLGKPSAIDIDDITSKVGRRIEPSEFNNLFDFAFLALHGGYGEDGNIQGLLEWYQIPYSGSGILPSAIGIDKGIQKELFAEFGFQQPKTFKISRKYLTLSENIADNQGLFDNFKAQIGLPFVVKAAHQGSSIGISVVDQNATVNEFNNALEKAFFVEKVYYSQWDNFSANEKIEYIKNLVDIRQGIGLPLAAYHLKDNKNKELIYHPDKLLDYLDDHFKTTKETIVLEALNSEYEVLIEEFIQGKEFSCIVIQNEEGLPVALPPTEIVKGNEVFDYRSKYLPGMSRKVTPIRIEDYQILQIQKACCELFNKMYFDVYARIDGFITDSGDIFLNDPNTTSGMMPSSFFFHQAAEIGLNPSQFLTYIIRTSLTQRLLSGKQNFFIQKQLDDLDNIIETERSSEKQKQKVGVMMGGFSSERHISIESGRNIYEKLASSEKYEPVPIFLTGNSDKHELYELPINILLKDNADDIKEKILIALNEPKHNIIKHLIESTEEITNKYASKAIFKPRPISYHELKSVVDVVFIALHGRPGEDGEVQKQLEKFEIPYNGSGIETSKLTIDKYLTNETLKQNGFVVTEHELVYKKDWQSDNSQFIKKIESKFNYPFIAKPSDDGCSSAVKKIDNRKELEAFSALIFREYDEELTDSEVKVLQLNKNEEFPFKEFFLIEDLISSNGADHFLEITGGLLTRKDNGNISYEIFEPSEALASGSILSLEEKFLAGEGQNITPARFDKNIERNKEISAKVREDLKKVAKLLNIEGYARIDAFVRIYKDKVETIVIEVNSLPGMTPATCIFHQTAINGYKPYDFIDKILEYGMS